VSRSGGEVEGGGRVIVYNNMPFVACRMSTLRAAMSCELIVDVGIGVN